MEDLTPEQIQNLYNRASEKLLAASEGASDILNDLFTGRDPGLGYLKGAYFHPTRVTSPWVYTEISVNLMQTRLRELVIEMVPELPKMHVKALVPEATALEEDQNLLSNWGYRHANLKQAIRDTAMFGPMGTHVGMRLWADTEKDLPLHKRFRYQALSHTDCGYEPGLRRFVWHKYTTGNAEDITEVTDIFFPTKDDLDCMLYRFEREVTQQADPLKGLGKLVYSGMLGAACPVRIASFLTAPPGEDIAPVECMSWVPLLRSIQAKLEARDREARSVVNGVLYDSRKIDKKHIDALSQSATGETVYIPVNVDDGMNDGVSHTMRPLERRSSMMELNAAVEMDIAMLDDVIGTSAMNRGASVGPRKSAAEASILSQASSRRTRDRLSVIAELLADVEQAKFTWQRKVYGDKIKIPLAAGLSRVVHIPKPEVALMAFRVDVVELGNLSRQGQIETYAAAVTLVGQTFAQFPNGEPPPAVKEALRRYLHALGAQDISQLIQDPLMSGGPKERYIQYLKVPYEGLKTDPNDPAEPFVMYYSAQYNDPSTSPEARIELGKAINFYSQQQQQQAAAQQAQQLAQQQQAGPGGVPVNPVSLV